MRKRPRLLPDIPGLLCLSIFTVTTLLQAPRVLGDGDTLWHVRIGGEILRRGEILTHDLYSHTVSGKPWVAHEWLSEVIMALLHAWGGLAAVALFFILLATLSLWILHRQARHIAGEWPALMATLIAYPLLLSHLLARPHIFTWFFASTTLFLLFRGGRSLWVLPPLTILWANLHGGVFIGLILQGIFIFGAVLDKWPWSRGETAQWTIGLRRPLLVLLASVAAVCVNPFGYSLYLFPFQVTDAIFIRNIGEWLPPNFQTMPHFRLYLLSLVALLALNKVRTTWTERLLILFLLNAALTHHRHMSMTGLLLIPFYAGAIRQASARATQPLSTSGEEIPLSPWTGPALATTTALLVGLLAGNPSTTAGKALTARFPMPESYSEDAVAYLRKHRPAGKMFNEYAWGDYLIFDLGERAQVFIDGRADMYGEEIFGDYIKASKLDGPPETIFEKYGIDWVLFPSRHPLVLFLKEGGAWQEVFSDDQASILTRLETAGP